MADTLSASAGFAETGVLRRVEFTVPGAPRTWQRARKGRHGPFHLTAECENKMSEVRDAWRLAGAEPFPRGVFIALSVSVFIERPGSHYGTGRNAYTLKPSAPTRPGSGKYGGDVDNFVKLVKDALNQVAYHDDAQIAEYLTPVGKWYADTGMPRTEVVLCEVPA